MIARWFSFFFFSMSSVSCVPMSSKKAVAQQMNSTQQQSLPSVKSTLTMEEAVELALKNKPDLQAYSFLVQEQEYKVKEAWGKYLPLINLQATWQGRSHQKGFQDGATLTGTQLIYSGQGPQIAGRVAREGKHVVMAEKERVEQLLRFNVERAFLLSWQQQQQRSSINALDGASLADIALAKRQQELQLLDKTDWLKRIESRALALSAVQTYVDATRSAEKELDFLLGESIKLYDEETKLVWRPRLFIRPPSNDTCLKAALKYRPDLKKALKQIALDDASERYEQGGYWPTITVQADVGRGGTQIVAGSDVDIVSSGATTQGFREVFLNFNWNLLDQLTSRFRSQQARARKMSSLLQYENTVLEAKKEVLVEYHAFLSVYTALRAKSYEYRRAKNQFDRDRQEFELGLTSAIIFAKKREDWLETHFAWLSSVAQTALQQQKLLFVCGYPSETFS